eukprot:4109576-Prymnesium_polylepis.1
MEHNFAPDGGGSSMYLALNGKLEYTLPAPPGRWLSIRQQGIRTMQFEEGTIEDLDFPYSCPAGVVGSSSPADQLGPGCSRPW